MIFNLLMYIISLVPIFLILFLIYYFDDIEKEPLWLLVTLFFGGVLSIILIRVMTNMFTVFDPDTFFGDGTGFNAFLQYFTSVGVIEEISKFVILYIVVSRNKNFNCIFDAIVYGVFVSMGFAAVENFTYIFINGDLSTLILRSMLTIPAHGSFGIIMGYFMGNARYFKDEEQISRSRFHKYCSFFVPMILHGGYDYLLSLSEQHGALFLYIFFGYAIVLFVFSILKIVEFYKLKLEFNKSIIDNNENQVYYGNVAHLEKLETEKSESFNNNGFSNLDNINIKNNSKSIDINNIKPINNSNENINLDNIMPINNNIDNLIQKNNLSNINNNQPIDLLKVNNQINENDKKNINNDNNIHDINHDMDVLFNIPTDNVNSDSNNNNDLKNRLF